MNRKNLFVLWGVLYGLGAVLGFVPSPEGALKVLMIALAVACFIPPLMLNRVGGAGTVRLVRDLSIIWLVLTVVLIVANIASVTASTLVGNVLHCLLVVISSPMVAGQWWIVSLFGWAFVLFDAVQRLKRK